MRLLILGMNYAPEVTGIAPYTAGLAEHLASLGHQVTVATTFPHYPQWAVQEPYRGRWRVVESRGGVTVKRTPVVIPRKGSAFARIGYDSSLTVGTLLSALPNRPADVVLVVTPPIQLGLVGALLARLWGARLALLIKDLPLEAALAVGMLRRGPIYRVGRAIERLVYRAADRVVVISEGFRHALRRRGVPAEKIALIPDWANTDVIRPSAPDPGVRAMLGAAPDDFLLLHTGNMGEKQGLATAVDAAALAGGHLRLTLVGDGSDRPMLEQLVTSPRFANVRLLPLQPADQFARVLAAADALLLVQRAEVRDAVAPSKLLTYMAAGRPVLASVHADSEAANIVREARCGVLVEPEDPASLATAAQALAGDATLRHGLGANGRRHVEEHFARDQVLTRLESTLAGLASR